MKEKEILKETVSKGKPDVEKKPKKRYYKPRKKKEEEDTITNQVENSEKPYLAASNNITIPKKVGSYCMGGGKGFCIHLDKKPNLLHRKCMKLFLGWSWSDYKSK